MSPWEAWHGPGLAFESPWPSRVAAMESAFAVEAAEHERSIVDVVEALAKGMGT